MAAPSVGIALRSAFCRLVGIQDDEVGATVRQAKGQDRFLCQSMFLYDLAAGGSGYVAALRDHVGAALRGAVAVLNCPKKCDASCQARLLTFGSQYEATRLDRHRALELAKHWK